MNILVFGVTRGYHISKGMFSGNQVVGFLDNASNLWGSKIDGVKVYSPEEIHSLLYDCIVLMSVHKDEMMGQLKELGVDRNKIKTPEEYVREFAQYSLQIFDEDPIRFDNLFKGIAIVEHVLDSNGATMAALSLAGTFQKLGYHVTLVAPYAIEEHLRFCVTHHMTVILDPTMKYCDAERLIWLDQFSLVIINSISVMNVVPRNWSTQVIWWLHDPPSGYSHISKKLIEAADKSNVYVYAVSKIAQMGFHKCFSRLSAKLLPFGIPDFATKESLKAKYEYDGEILRLAIVGHINRNKGQDILLDALGLLPNKDLMNIEVFIVGDDMSAAVAQNIKEHAKKFKNVHFTGLISHDQMKIMHRETINVTVCASDYETMSIVVMEGLMNGEVCIITKNIGIADYLTNKKDCLMYEYGDSAALAEHIQWIMSHRHEAREMQKQARKIYERFFTMDKFANRVKKIIADVKQENF